MKNVAVQFFRSRFALLIFVATLIFALIGVVSISVAVAHGSEDAGWQMSQLVSAITPILLLAVVVEYLSRIADALEKPGVLGFEDEAGE